MTAVASWSELWAAAKDVDILAVAQSLGANLRKQGREWVGHCPGKCTKNGDGFVIDPAKGVFLCRPSGSGGDAIMMVEHCRGCNRVEAAEFLTGQDRPNGAQEQTDAERAEAERQRAKRAADNQRRAAVQARLDAVRLIRDGETVASILERAVALPGSPAEDYLIHRGAGLPRSMSRDLRFVEDLHYWGHADHETDDFSLVATLPAMVAVIRAVNGEMVGLHITYLDPKGPRKWVASWEADLPPYLRRNPAKKFRKVVERMNGAMIRLGAIADTLVLGEGIETVASYAKRGFAPEDASFGVAMSLGNLSGGAICQIDRPPDLDEHGKPIPFAGGKPPSIPNGIPDPSKPGVILPAHVKRVMLLGDGDSDRVATRAALITAGRRYRKEGREVVIDMAPPGEDFASMSREVNAFTAGRAQ